jgi:hypothetical protein
MVCCAIPVEQILILFSVNHSYAKGAKMPYKRVTVEIEFDNLVNTDDTQRIPRIIENCNREFINALGVNIVKVKLIVPSK